MWLFNETVLYMFHNQHFNYYRDNKHNLLHDGGIANRNSSYHDNERNNNGNDNCRKKRNDNLVCLL